MCGFFSLLTNIMSLCGVYILWNINSDLEERVDKLEKIVTNKNVEEGGFTKWFG